MNTPYDEGIYSRATMNAGLAGMGVKRRHDYGVSVQVREVVASACSERGFQVSMGMLVRPQQEG